MTLKELVMSGRPYKVMQSTQVLPETVYIVPNNHTLDGYYDYNVVVSNKDMAQIQEKIEKYEKIKNSPMWKKLEGE